MNWIKELMDEYSTKSVSDGRLKRLRAAFGDNPAHVMDQAVTLYMKDGNEFFPKVGSLVRYVEKAREIQNRWGEYWTRQLEEKSIEEIDDILLQWEIDTGRMNLEMIGAEYVTAE